jgi:hypothetical protein
LSVSETSTRRTNSGKHRSTPQAIVKSNPTRKELSQAKFSCYLTSPFAKKKATSTSMKKPLPSPILNRASKNNNHSVNTNRMLNTPKTTIFRLTIGCRESMCSTCLKRIDINGSRISSSLLCSSCLELVRKCQPIDSVKSTGLSKDEENELRQIVNMILEEFQDHFAQALSLSMKQMTQHLSSNIHLFYNHYQQEFEQLTKKYRHTFLERFVQLMNKHQSNQLNHERIIKSKSKQIISHRVNAVATIRSMRKDNNNNKKKQKQTMCYTLIKFSLDRSCLSIRYLICVRSTVH